MSISDLYLARKKALLTMLSCFVFVFFTSAMMPVLDCTELESDATWEVASTNGLSLCGSGTKSLTVTSDSSYTGTVLTYQWQQSANGVSYTDFGTNSSSITTPSISASTFFQCIVSCGSGINANEITVGPIQITVTPNVTPTITISQTSGTNPACVGASVTFTATITNGGASPTYQWQVNGSNAGTNSPTFTTSSITNGQSVTCILTSNAACASPASVTSSGITMTINPIVAPTISIAISAGTNPSCAGSSVTFTASISNGGASPSYQWKVGGVNAGTNSPTFTTTTITNNQIVTCVLTSNAPCVSPTSVTSAGITMTINPVVVPTISIALTSGTNPACVGASLTFTATVTNAGPTPTYQWRVNGVNFGTNIPTFTTNALTNGQAVTCVLTSSAACATPSQVTSSAITMTINPILTPSVSIAVTAGTNPSCAGSSITFTATPTNGGASPSYQWQLNGNNVGSNQNTYSNAGITNGQVVTCIVTSNAPCASPTVVTSNAITVLVNTTFAPAVSINLTGGSNPTCAGSSLTFTATPTNGGTTPSYQWFVAGNPVGSNSPTFTSTAITNGQSVTCILTSSASCASPTTATSNAIVITVNSVLVPTISIALTSGTNPTCAGSSLTFTATPTSGGSSPSYQWKINGTNQPGNAATFTTNTITNGQAVTCVLTSSESCANPTTANSNSITINITPQVTPVVNIALTSGSLPACPGASLTFTATPTNGGSTPAYLWQVDGVASGTNSSVFTTTTLTDNQVVTCVLTSNATCASPLTDVSNSILVDIQAAVLPSVSIAVTSGSATSCAGTPITFTATPTNGGTPQYLWRIDNVSTGVTASTFTSSTLTNGQTITCTLTSSAPCANPAQVTSNGITVIIRQLPTLALFQVNGPTPICQGNTIDLVAAFSGNPPFSGSISPSLSFNTAGSDFLSSIQIPVTVNQIGTSNFQFTELVDVFGCEATPSAISSIVSVFVNQTPSLTAIDNLGTFCEGQLLPAVPLTSSMSNSTFSWTSAPFVGYQNASGANEIPGGIADIDNATSAITSEVCVTAFAPGSGCPSAQECFALAVTPGPSILQKPDFVFCEGQEIQNIPFQSAVAADITWSMSGQNLGFGNNGGSFIIQGFAQISGEVVVTQQVNVEASAGDCISTMQFDVTVVPKPTSSTDAEFAYCADSEFEDFPLTGNNDAANVYEWVLNEANVVGLFEESGINVVSLNPTNSNALSNSNTISITPKITVLSVECAGDPQVITIFVNPEPVINTPSAPVVCNGVEFVVPFSSNNVPTSTFAWQVPVGQQMSIQPNAGTQNLIATFNHAENSTQSLNIEAWPIFTDHGLSCFGDTVVFVQSAYPIPDINITAQDLDLCSEENVALSIASNTSPPSSWSWTSSSAEITGGSSCSSNCSTNISDQLINNSGADQSIQYSFTTFIDENTTCSSTSSSNSATIVVHTIPATPSLDVVPDSICAGSENNYLHATTQPNQTLTWTLSPADAGSIVAGSAGGNTAYVSSTGIVDEDINVMLHTSDAFGCSASSTFDISVVPNPSATDFFVHAINPGTTGMFLVLMPASSNYAYQWGSTDTTGVWSETTFDGEVGQNFLIGNQFTPGQFVYWVEVMDGDCKTKIFYNAPVSNEELVFSNEWLIYPIPASEKMTLQANHVLNGIDVKVFDSFGRVCLFYNSNVANSQFDIDISSLDVGCYFMELYSGQERSICKFMKQ
jgi:hypothetical protein